MCGRFSLTIAEKQTFLNRFGLTSIDFELKPRYNIAPSQMIPIITNENPKSLSQGKWGMIPKGIEDSNFGFKTINARSENVLNSKLYKKHFLMHRCLIVADSFYEWDRKNPKNKIPHRIMLKGGELFSFAGIFNHWSENVMTVSMFTCDSNDLMKKIHHRMPVILKKEDEVNWISDISQNQALELLKPYPSPGMREYAVSSLVNNSRNEIPEVINPMKSKNASLDAFV